MGLNEMPGLKAFLVFCIILLCFIPATSLVVDALKGEKPLTRDKTGKIELKINRIYFLDYLIVVIPVFLLLIGFISDNYKEKSISFEILGVGFMVLLMSSYNRRIDIPKLNRLILVVCSLLGIIAFLATNISVENDIESIVTLYFPIVAYMYLMGSRWIIKLLTGTYPITVDKTFKVGRVSYRYNRKVSGWDAIWSLINLIVIPIIIIAFSNVDLVFI